jgi:uroporphyrinogen decarboxylase
MTSRERVLAAINHRQPDRCPVDFWARTDVAARLRNHLGLKTQEELLERLGIDVRLVPIAERIPAFEARVNGRLGGSSESSGKPYILYPDGRFEDAWGVVRKLGQDGLYDQWVDGPFAADRDLDRFAWPQGDLYEPVEAVRARAAAHGGRYALLGRLNLPFKAAWHMRGFENFLCDMMAEPDYARELLRRVADYEVEKSLRLVRAGVDIIGIYGDLAMQDRMLVHPGAWRQTEKPILADMVRRLRAVNPALKIFFHSDGDITEIIPDYIDVGADILNPIQPECMDPAAVKRDFGDRITMHGTLSIQRTLPKGTPADVRREVRERIARCGGGGGLILCPSNLLQNDTPLENILAIYDAQEPERQFTTKSTKDTKNGAKKTKGRKTRL